MQEAAGTIRSSLSRVGAKNGMSLNAMQSKCLKAPCYFGESCLWLPYLEWDNPENAPPPYMYSARCMSRCEFLYITRDSVSQLFKVFSPWLEDRFEFFREGVIEGLREKFEGAKFEEQHDSLDAEKGRYVCGTVPELDGKARDSSVSRHSSRQNARLPPVVDWALADLMLPQDDMSLSARHYEVLKRAGAGPTLERTAGPTREQPGFLRAARQDDVRLDQIQIGQAQDHLLTDAPFTPRQSAEVELQARARSMGR